MNDSRAPLSLRERMRDSRESLSASLTQVSREREKIALLDKFIRLQEPQHLRAIAVEALADALAAQHLNINLTEEAIAMEDASDSPIIDRLRVRCSLMQFEELRKILGCHRQTLYDYVKEGRIEAQLVGSRIKFDPRAVIRYLQARQTGRPR